MWWLTPTVLVILIGIISVMSSLGSQNNQADEGRKPQLTRAPSVLERLKSFNLYRYGSGEFNPFPPELVTYQTIEQPQTAQLEDAAVHDHQVMERPQPTQVDEPAVHDHQVMERPQPTQVDEPAIHDHQVTRSKSDTRPASGDKPVKLVQKVKSAGSISDLGHFEEEEEEGPIDRRRPSTVREGKSRVSDLHHLRGDEEVDAKADDFINRFKQQLKLQRLESFKRYSEMLRGLN